MQRRDAAEVAAIKSEQLATLTDAVQYNCDVSDARHGGDYSLCVCLMKTREFYRWEKRLGFRERTRHALALLKRI